MVLKIVARVTGKEGNVSSSHAGRLYKGGRVRRTAAPGVTGIATRRASEGYWWGPGNVTNEVSRRGRIRRELIDRPMRLWVAMGIGNGR
jgi:hypothetical protein